MREKRNTAFMCRLALQQYLQILRVVVDDYPLAKTYERKSLEQSKTCPTRNDWHEIRRIKTPIFTEKGYHQTDPYSAWLNYQAADCSKQKL
jgi:hypothetical protein